MADKLNMFGSNHDVFGSSDSNLILKTKGKIKLLIGGKFIDLVKDGKLNTDDTKWVLEASKVGTSDGIYVVDGKVTVVAGGKLIELTGESGTTYVSFMESLETTSDLKELALHNIGFIYDTMDSIDSNAIKNGIIYVEDTKKLYTVIGGQVSEYTFEFPNPYTKLFVVSKNDSSLGAILITGEGINNSLAFNSLYIYTEYSDSYFQSEGNIYFQVGNSTYLTLTSSDTRVDNTFKCNKIQSTSASDSSGFRLYTQSGESYLEVDNLTVRNNNDTETLYPEYYYYNNNIISDIDNYYEDKEDEDDEGENEDTYQYTITPVYENTYKEGDLLYIPLTTHGRITVTEEDDDGDVTTYTEETDYYKVYMLPFKVLKQENDDEEEEETSDFLVELLYDTLSDEVKEVIDEVDLGDELKGSIIFQHNVDYTPKSSSVGFDILNNEDLVIARHGDITDLGLMFVENGSEKAITGVGIYAQLGIFDNACYTNKANLSSDDNSTRFASTEWVRKYVDSKIV